MARPCRIEGHSYVGQQQYFLTICADQRAEFFRNDETARMAIDLFLQTASSHRFDVITYCVMPDHMHALTEGRDDGAELEPFVKIAKQKTGYEFKQQHRTRLWQPGYYEHVLRSDERTADVVRYIIENPLRKRLVENVLDYPYWGSSLYSREDLLASIGMHR